MDLSKFLPISAVSFAYARAALLHFKFMIILPFLTSQIVSNGNFNTHKQTDDVVKVSKLLFQIDSLFVLLFLISLSLRRLEYNYIRPLLALYYQQICRPKLDTKRSGVRNLNLINASSIPSIICHQHRGPKWQTSEIGTHIQTIMISIREANYNNNSVKLAVK